MTDLVGFFACAMVLLTFCMRDMAVLRALAIVSNIAFIVYAAMADLVPVLVLHAILLPINLHALRSALTVLRRSGPRHAGSRRPGGWLEGLGLDGLAGAHGRRVLAAGRRAAYRSSHTRD